MVRLGPDSNKRHRRLRKVALLAIAIALIWCFANTVYANWTLHYQHTTTYIVQSGDTVDSIAEKFDSRHYLLDVRQWLLDKNHLFNGQVSPGQTLIVPAGR